MHVAVGLVFNARGEILIAQRPPGKSQSGLWEFPGGKVEANETAFQALQRELFEEIGIQVITAEAWLQVEYAYSDRHVLLDTWRVTEFSGEPQGKEQQLVKWISIACLDQFQFPAGNREIIAKLCDNSANFY
jgi:8-oxo-dGTP diphosphatase